MEWYLGNFSKKSPLNKDHLFTKIILLLYRVIYPYKTVLSMNCVPHVVSRKARVISDLL